MGMLEVNQDTFENEVLKSDLPVLVDFWAPWCGPCKAITPIVDDIAKEYEGKIKVCKINIDSSPNVANQFSIMSIPTLLIFNKGEVENQIIGLVGKDKIIAKFSHLI
jgi:thioredoxin